jgi:NhaP-type Na+/H+ or K+/H+ antiporter
MAGALAFGLLIGWITSSILRRAKRDSLTDISTIIAALGGAAVTGLFSKGNGEFGIYCIGLAIGFWWYINRAMRPDAPDWLGERPSSRASSSGIDQIPPVANR